MAEEEVTEVVVPADVTEVVVRSDEGVKTVKLPPMGTGPTSPVEVSSQHGPITLEESDGTVLFESEPGESDIHLQVRRATDES